MDNSNITSPPRSQSMAYAAASPANTLWSKLVYYVRFNTKAFVAGVGLLLVVLVLITDGIGGGAGGGVSIASAAHGGLRL